MTGTPVITKSIEPAVALFEMKPKYGKYDGLIGSVPATKLNGLPLMFAYFINRNCAGKLVMTGIALMFI